MQHIQVLYHELNPSSIINLDQPCHYEEFHRLTGYTELDSSSFRQEINDTYYAEMERSTGHWSRLLDHISKWGIVYPIVVSTGIPKLRRPSIVPRSYRYTNSQYWIVCDTQGGSRILAAQKLGLKIPALINDHVGLFRNLSPIRVRDLPNYGVDVDEIYLSATYGVQIRQFPRLHLDVDDTEYAKHRRAAIKKVLYQHLSPININMEKRIEHDPTND